MPTALLALLAAAAPLRDEAPLELHPIYQRLAEMRAIAEQARIAAAFGDVPVERIEFVRTDVYRVSAERCHLEVRIVGLPVPEGVAGGRRFEVKAGAKVCAS